MRRREFIAILGGAAAWPLSAGLALVRDSRSRSAEAATARVGFLSVPPSGSSPIFETFQAGLAELGYIDGKISLSNGVVPRARTQNCQDSQPS
jgi:hypothetical protein